MFAYDLRLLFLSASFCAIIPGHPSCALLTHGNNLGVPWLWEMSGELDTGSREASMAFWA